MNLVKFRIKFFKIVPNILIGIGLLFLLLSYGPLLYDELWYNWKNLKNQDISINNPNGTLDSPFARFLTTSPITIDPVNKDFSVVIEKIGVNAPVQKDVSVVDYDPNEEIFKKPILKKNKSILIEADPLAEIIPPEVDSNIKKEILKHITLL